MVPNSKPVTLCQHCRGAPGMLTSFADALSFTPELERPLLQRGALVWHAGPQR